MNMKDYLANTDWAVSPLLRAIGDSREKINKWDLSLQHLRNLESYLEGIDPNGRGEWHLRFFTQEWGDEPTPANVNKRVIYAEEQLVARRRSRSILCGSVLLIAQNGIKTVLGPPSAWRHMRGQMLSLRGHCILDAVWHGRNQAAHIEGLTAGGPSHLYFTDLEHRFGPQFSIDTNADHIAELIVRDVLGWIDWKGEEVYYPGHNGPTPYVADMIALGASVGR